MKTAMQEIPQISLAEIRRLKAAQQRRDARTAFRGKGARTKETRR